ncbi:hypothetical protein HZA87_03865 [Candidatus Uhrbacteria bacterium]|nr:hypothetical protein [Candidatus Uhrbacteria bacterium]
MRQFFLTFLLIMTAVVSLTFGGMVVMNHMDGVMLSAGCVTSPCMTPQAGGMDSASCLSYCLQAATVNGIVPMSADAQALVLLSFVIIVFSARVFDKEVVVQIFRRGHHLRKLLLQRQLSTVIIRD